MAAVANTLSISRNDLPQALQTLTDQPLELDGPEALNLAFRAFNDLSNELSAASR